MAMLDKVRENRVRRLAYRLGYQVIKNSSPGGLTDRYMVVPLKDAFSMTLDDVEEFLVRASGSQEPPPTKSQAKPKAKNRK